MSSSTRTYELPQRRSSRLVREDFATGARPNSRVTSRHLGHSSGSRAFISEDARAHVTSRFFGLGDLVRYLNAVADAGDADVRPRVASILDG